jgi:MIP family channel proteins
VEQRDTPAYVAEFIGTFFLVFFICSYISLTSVGGFELAALGLIHAFALAMLIYTLGGTSGAHFNPAVTAALFALRKIRAVDAGIYVAVQLAGGLAGALMVKALYLDEGKAVNYGATLVNPARLQHVFPALICEIIGTFVLLWAIMGTAVNPRGSKAFAGWVIGIALGAGVMIFGPLEGAGFNPARSLGPAIVSGKFTDFWIYIVGPLVGALAAAFLYNWMEIAPKGREAAPPIETLD